MLEPNGLQLTARKACETLWGCAVSVVVPAGDCVAWGLLLLDIPYTGGLLHVPLSRWSLELHSSHWGPVCAVL
jgi:hypothetical protein